jgi:hypothetical protein
VPRPWDPPNDGSDGIHTAVRPAVRPGVVATDAGGTPPVSALVADLPRAARFGSVGQVHGTADTRTTPRDKC